MLELLIMGGWVMAPLLLCSLIAVTIIAERLLFFRRATATAGGEQVLQLTAAGNSGQALQLLAAAPQPLLKVLKAGIEQPASPAKAMEAAAVAEIAGMKRGLPVLDTIITLSPLLGLLGTIIGMIDSFQIMAVAGSGQPHAVTGGVAEALIATAGGISVAVATLVPYNYLLAQVERETERIEEYATRLELSLQAAEAGK
ncbi:MAG: MotA/TolQ/ExbB proton channel family protein [Sporomusaceae bacterium]|nr:MotA/TolQ/ExbB proton channel family protein [Sporomusaceae bacterium]